MRPLKYPLEPLAELRDRRVDEAVGDLAHAARERDAAERKRRATERDILVHATTVERVRRAEAEALAQGGLRAADLAQAAAWEVRVAAERDGLASGLDQARAVEAAARGQEGRALDEVAERRAQAQVVAKDRARWDGARRKRAEAREEEALSEAWRPSKP
jgi:hypothetical protein